MKENSSSSDIRTVLIVGGGVAGLTAAAALGARGITVDVIDLKKGAEGSGLGIQNRGVDALDAVGALDDVVAAGAAHKKAPLRFYDSEGTLVFDPSPPPREDGKPSYIIVYRPLLAQILTARAKSAGVSVRIGLSISSLTQHEDRVEVDFTDGTSGSYDLVVGADGLRSSVRSIVFGDEVKPVSTGTISLRWVPRGIARIGEAGFYYGDDTEMVVIPMHDDMTYVSVQHPDDRKLNDHEARLLLRKKLSQFSVPLLTELHRNLAEDEHVLVRRYESLLVPSPWHRGRVVLIGDAAHATTAHLGSGGVMALEDAVVLAEELAAPGTVESRLDAFERRRFERCRTVVETSVQLSDMQKAGANATEMGAARGPAMEVLAQSY
ncbi:FAD-dependent monooxygenase [Rhodococcus sp. LB1]|uniref:FAD-dependent monooxygenase n=1 Tax=Rhodococcus sp. LB1 TaxID=1807499 RepID=UPI00077ACC7D|nr:FAD-dependent monooxygenase [Rhodococcus sp. LB1]KXX54212.1 hypothetical protein AZG88_25130 [Rhodococcus sp. LB1]